MISNGFVHRDLAARNVLINAAKMAKVCDFGLSRFLDEEFYMSGGGHLPVSIGFPCNLFHSDEMDGCRMSAEVRIQPGIRSVSPLVLTSFSLSF